MFHLLLSGLTGRLAVLFSQVCGGNITGFRRLQRSHVTILTEILATIVVYIFPGDLTAAPCAFNDHLFTPLPIANYYVF